MLTPACSACGITTFQILNKFFTQLFAPSVILLLENTLLTADNNLAEKQLV